MTGLINGKQCPPHWNAVDEFIKMFPEVELVTDRIITEEAALPAPDFWQKLWLFLHQLGFAPLVGAFLCFTFVFY